MELANQIKKYRGEKSISQEELAERIYVSRQTISSWENGKAKYQWILVALAAAVITFIVIVIMSMVAGFLFYN